MKSILLSIRPEWVAKILDGKKTIEIRKKFPKDYVGWVYIYCTKGKPYLVNDLGNYVLSYNHKQWANSIVNSKVVARFWCDKVEEITFNGYFHPNDNEYTTNTMSGKELMKASCLDLNHLVWYFDGKHKYTNVGYAIHISKLEVFDRPKELSEFRYTTCPKTNCEYCKYNKTVEGDLYCTRKTLTKAPHNYCYIEE